MNMVKLLQWLCESHTPITSNRGLYPNPSMPFIQPVTSLSKSITQKNMQTGICPASQPKWFWGYGN